MAPNYYVDILTFMPGGFGPKNSKKYDDVIKVWPLTTNDVSHMFDLKKFNFSLNGFIYKTN